MQKNLRKTCDLFLVRHGETDWNTQHRHQGRLPVPLNEEGQRQIKETAAALKGRTQSIQTTQGPATICSSPVIRTRESAAILRQEMGLGTVSFHEGLTEFNMGTWTGRTTSSLRKESCWNDFIDHPEEIIFPDGESLREIQQRVLSALDEILERNSASVIIMSHGGPLQILLLHFLGLSLKHFHRFQVSNGGFTHLRLKPNQMARFLCINWTPTSR